ncbi:MAG TPA: undecaprenyl-diphosphatase [Lachnospiraceae bacterium]|nr:undecaprenyl-diphosphatase [Lachnospiraceae bacterium]
MVWEIIKTIIFGIVEGITEWLPISSTGHIILLEELIGKLRTEEFMEMFDVLIQLGAIMAIVVIYFNKLNPFDKRKDKKERNRSIRLWCKVIVSCIPAALIGFLFDDIIDKYLFNPFVVAVMLILYGIAFIVVENRHTGKSFKYRELDKLPYKTAFFIGVFQVLALIPGTSRSGATILGGMLLGASRSVSAEFTFFLAIPVMLGAGLLKIVKFGFNFTVIEIIILLIGMLVSFGVSYLAVKFLMNYIKKNDFKIFGFYRIALGCVVLIYFIFIR